MKQWMDEKAELTVEIGAGWLSRYEFANLGPGSVVRSQAEAGTPVIVRLNGAFFSQAAITVTDSPTGTPGEQWLCAIMQSLEEPVDDFPRPSRGDTADELLPFAIQIGRISMRMADLSGTGPYSLINLNIPLSVEEDADLLVAGRIAARGKVVVIGEHMGIRITSLNYTLPAQSLPRTTGSILARGYTAERIKDYDFHMPDRFTKRAIERAHELHLDFLRGYQSLFPEFSAWKLELIDQLNYGEWLDDESRSAGCVLGFRAASRRRDYEREREERLPETILIEDRDSIHRFSPAFAATFKEHLARFVQSDESLPFQIALDPSTANILDKDPHFDIGLSCLRNSWLRIADLRIGQAAGADTALRSEKPALQDRRSGMILLVRFTGEKGQKIDIVYPEGLIDPYLPALGR